MEEPMETMALEKNAELAEWIRLSSDTASKLTAAFHFTDNNLKKNDNHKRFIFRIGR
jgi:hypothetical protein